MTFHPGRAGADRAVLLAPGAGSGSDAPALVAVAEALAGEGIPTLRFDFGYRLAGRRAPDRAPVLLGAVREAAAELAQRSGLAADRLVLGGRSMGGRMCSLAVGDPDDPLPALGLLLLGYPLVSPRRQPARSPAGGRPGASRTEHFGRLALAVCFISGDRDALAPLASLEAATAMVPGEVTLHVLAGADHGYRVPKKLAPQGTEDALAEAARVSAAWVCALPAR